MSKLFSIAFLSASLFFVSCASVPKADPTLDSQAKQFKTEKDKAVIYLYRNEFMGGAVKMDVAINDQIIGATQTGNYMRIVVSPGKQRLSSHAENTDYLELTTSSDRIYYVWQETKMGVLYARTKLNIVDEATGRTGVGECSLVNHIQPTAQQN